MMTPNTNKTLDDKYEIIHEIKKGGFGIVYYGVDKKLNKPVAIKEIASNLLDDPKYLDMFQEEALNIAKLSHNNIVHIYELKKLANGHLFIIMEYIDGIDLEKVIRNLKKEQKVLPAHLAVFIISEICMALDYAHQRRDAFTNKPLNLVHQDISPSNIMISRFGGVKLIDFGIASVKRHQHKEKKDNKLRGKIPYMAPEQLLMGNHPDHRSDLFSLGLVLYEALTGERLFNSQEEVLAAGKNAKLFRKTLKNRKISGALFKIISRALEIDISRRYQSANHMYIDLLQYLISCNETGELMDQLAEHVSEQFEARTPPSEFTHAISSTSDSLSQPSPTNSYMNSWESGGLVAHQPLPNPELSQPLLADKFDQTQFNTISTMELDAEDEDLKTVIDVIRISASTHKKKFVMGFLTIFMALIFFAVLDTMNGWTQVGVRMYDWIFPPAIEVQSVPPNAQVYLDGHPLQGRSPLQIEEISPGAHKLELRLDGYKPIVKSVFVPRRGKIQVQGVTGQEDSHRYLFRFNTQIEITSRPANADVYVNGILYSQKTPCAITWEAGMPFSLELRKPGFRRLTGYSLNTVEGYDEVDDRRFWHLNVLFNDYTKYAISGVFAKDVTIATVPDGVEVIDIDTNRSLGRATRNRIFLLPAGTHNFELQKQNFISKRVQIVVDENSPSRIKAILSRRVQFTVKDKTNPTGKDIGATLISLKTGRNEYLRNSRRTPTELTLPAYNFQAVFSKAGYRSKQVSIAPGMHNVQITLEPLPTDIKITVVDALTEEVVQDAKIQYNWLDRPRPQDVAFQVTDVSGQSRGTLAAGNYVFRIIKAGYNTETRNVIARAGEALSYVVELYPAN